MKNIKQVAVSPEDISKVIILLRGKKVIMDSSLASLYGVSTQVLNQAVKRNIGRFPSDFMFQLTKKESRSLISQFVISKNAGRGGRRKLAYVFTEQGVAMLSSVLNSQKAISVNIEIMRTFSRIREMLLSHKELQHKIVAVVFEALRKLLEPPAVPVRPRIGFHP
jgi:hypothetical protein